MSKVLEIYMAAWEFLMGLAEALLVAGKFLVIEYPLVGLAVWGLCFWHNQKLQESVYNHPRAFTGMVMFIRFAFAPVMLPFVIVSAIRRRPKWAYRSAWEYYKGELG